MDIKEEDILGDAIDSHWYYRSKLAALGRLLDNVPFRVIVDVGAGSGFFSRKLLGTTDAESAWCIDINYAHDRNDEVGGKPVFFRKEFEAVDFDLMLMMDVIEHVDDDREFLAQCIGHLPSGGHVLISVPAFEWLWSPHDDYLGHKRRYTLKRLTSLIEETGLTPVKSCYYFANVLPIAVASRLTDRLFSSNHEPRSQLTRHSRFVNSVLLGLCMSELPWFSINRVAGLTVFSLARKS